MNENSARQPQDISPQANDRTTEIQLQPYEAPDLRDYGTVQELTRTSPTATISTDGGTVGINVYASST